MVTVDDMYTGIEADEVRYFHNPKSGKVDAVAGSDVNRYLKENCLTNNRGTYWRDAGGNAYDLPDGMDEDTWLKEWEAVGNPLTRAEDGHNRSDYAEEVYKYRTPKGDVSVRMGDDGAFRKEYAATYGGAPTRLSSRMFNGVLLSGPQSALLNLASVTQGYELTAEQLKSLGATDNDIARGAERTQERLLSRDNEVKHKLGRVGFLENEMRNRALKESGAEATGGASMVAAYGQAAADVMTKPLNIVGLGLVSLRDFGDMALRYGGEDGLEKLKERGAVQAWLDRWRLMGWRGMGRNPFTDEQWHEIFKEGLRKIKRNERLDEIRGKTLGAKVGSGAIDMAEYSGDMAMDGLLAAMVGAPGLVGGTLAHEAMGLTNEVKRQMTDKVMFNPATGKVEKVVAGRDFWSALGYGAANLGVEYVGEQVGGKVVGALTKPLKAVASKIVGREMSVLLGMMPGVMSKPKEGMIGRGLQKSARAWNRFASNPWAKAVADLTGIRQMTPSGLLEEMTEEVVQNFFGETFNLSGDRLTEDGQIAGTSLAEGGLAAWETLKQAPEFAAQMALYSLGMGLGTRGVRAMTRGYGTRATLRNALRGAGYTDAQLNGMDREAMQEAFRKTYMQGGDAAEASVGRVYGGRGSEELFAEVMRLGRVQATPNERFTELDTVDGDGNAVKVKGAKEVHDWLLGQLKAEARENGFSAVSVGIAQDAVTRGAMFLAKADLDEARRTMREMGMDAAFANFGNSGGVYDAFAEALAMRMVAHSSAYEGTTMGAFLEAMGKDALVSAMDTMEEAKVPDGDVLATMQAYERYVAGAEVERHAVGGNVPKVFDAEGRDVPWLDGADGSQSMSKDGVTIQYKPDGAYTVWADGRGRRVTRTVNGVPVIVRAQSAKRYFSTTEEAVAEANKLHAQLDAYERRQAALHEQAVRMYDETFGNTAGTRRNMTTLGSAFEDEGVFNELLQTLLSQGMGHPEAFRALATMKGAKLTDGSFAVFLDNMDSIADLAATIRHEGLHTGLSSMVDLTDEGDLAAFIESVSKWMDGRLVDAMGRPISAEAFARMGVRGKAVVLDEALAQLAELRARKPFLAGRIALLMNDLFNKDGRLGKLAGRALEEEARKTINAAFFRVHGGMRRGRDTNQAARPRAENAEASQATGGATEPGTETTTGTAPQEETQATFSVQAKTEDGTTPVTVVELINGPEALSNALPVKKDTFVGEASNEPSEGVNEASTDVTQDKEERKVEDRISDSQTEALQPPKPAPDGTVEVKPTRKTDEEMEKRVKSADRKFSAKGALERNKLLREQKAFFLNALNEIERDSASRWDEVNNDGAMKAQVENAISSYRNTIEDIHNFRYSDYDITGDTIRVKELEAKTNEAKAFLRGQGLLYRIDVPGDGTFEVIPTRKVLGELRKMASKMFSTPKADSNTSRGITDPMPIEPNLMMAKQDSFDAKLAEELLKPIVNLAKHGNKIKDYHRIHAVDGWRFATNGSVLVVLKDPNAKLTERSPEIDSVYNRSADGRASLDEKWGKGSIEIHIPVVRALRHLREVDAMFAGEDKKVLHVVHAFLLSDGGLGFAVNNAKAGTAQTFDADEAIEYLGAYDIGILSHAFEVFRKIGEAQASLKFHGKLRNGENIDSNAVVVNSKSGRAHALVIGVSLEDGVRGRALVNLGIQNGTIGLYPGANQTYATQSPETEKPTDAAKPIPTVKAPAKGKKSDEKLAPMGKPDSAWMDGGILNEDAIRNNISNPKLMSIINKLNGGEKRKKGAKPAKAQSAEAPVAQVPLVDLDELDLMGSDKQNAWAKNLLRDFMKRNGLGQGATEGEVDNINRALGNLTAKGIIDNKHSLRAYIDTAILTERKAQAQGEHAYNPAKEINVDSFDFGGTPAQNRYARKIVAGALNEVQYLIGERALDAFVNKLDAMTAKEIIDGKDGFSGRLNAQAHIANVETKGTMPARSVEGTIAQTEAPTESTTQATSARKEHASSQKNDELIFDEAGENELFALLDDVGLGTDDEGGNGTRFRMGSPRALGNDASDKLITNLPKVFRSIMERDKRLRTFEALSEALYKTLARNGRGRAWEVLRPYLRGTWNTISDLEEGWGLEDVSKMAANATLTRIEKRGSGILKTSPNGDGTSTKEQGNDGTGIQQGGVQGGGGVAEGAASRGERPDGGEDLGVGRGGRGDGRPNDELPSGLGGDEPALRVANGDGGAEGGDQGRGEGTVRGGAEAGARGVDVVPGVGGDGGLRSWGAAAQPAGVGVDNGADAGAGGVREGIAAPEAVLTPEAAGVAAKVSADRAVAKAQPAKNYVIPEENDGISDLRDKRSHAEANLAALHVLRMLRDEGRLDKATPEEQAILSRYAGWGGVAEAFDETKGDWAEAYAELKGLLPKEEYDEARRGTQYAHYTPIPVIRGIYDVLTETLDVGGPNLHFYEAGMGVGRFIGCLPKALRGATYEGVDIDPTTGAIAHALYPKAHLHTVGFQEVHLPDNSVDVVIGNPPFADIVLHDTDKRYRGMSMHNHFIAKQLDMLKPGGVGAFVVSRYFLDRKDPSIRQYIHGKAQFLGAVRLPSNAFKESAATDVVTDVVFFRKRVAGESVPEDGAAGSEWLDVKIWQPRERASHLKGIAINAWMANRYHGNSSDAVLGWMNTAPDTRYGPDGVRLVVEQGKWRGDLRKEIANVAKFYLEESGLKFDPQHVERDPAAISEAAVADGKVLEDMSHPVVMNGSYFQGSDGSLYIAGEDAYGHRTAQKVDETRKDASGGKKRWDEPEANVHLTPQEGRIVRAIHALTKVRYDLAQAETREGEGEATLDTLRGELNAAYKRFLSVAEGYGINRAQGSQTTYLSDQAIGRLMAFDPAFPQVLGLEIPKRPKPDEDGKRQRNNTIVGMELSPIFTRRVGEPRAKLRVHYDSAKDAMAAQMADSGRIYLPWLEKVTGKGRDEVLRDLDGLAFVNPDPSSGGDLIERSAYLSGDVKTKLELARNANEAPGTRGLYDANVKALEAVIPKDVEAEDITLRLGSNIVPSEVVNRFLISALDVELPVRYDAVSRKWRKENGNAYARTTKRNAKISGMLAPFSMNVKISDAILSALNGDKIVIKNFDNSVDKKSTEALNREIEEIRNLWDNWWKSDAKASRIITAEYNERVNRYADVTYDGSFLNFDGLSTDFTLNKHQCDAVARTVLTGNVLYNHVVGSGKTLTTICSVMTMRRMGLLHKPIVSVPNQLTEQWRNDWVKAYPNANVLCATDEEMGDKARRRAFYSRIQNGDYDAVILPHSMLSRLPLSPKMERYYIEKEISKRREQMDLSGKMDGRTIKRIENAIEKLKERLNRLSDGEKDETGIYFDTLGFDGFFLDEAHLFKNVPFICSKQVLGLGNPQGSKNAFGLLQKMNYLREFKSGSPTVFMTGTPISNTLSEVYTNMLLMAPQLMENANIHSMDEFLNTYGVISKEAEFDATGRIVEKERLRYITNVGDLMAMVRTYMDIVGYPELQASMEAVGKVYNVPEVEGGGMRSIAVPRSPEQTLYFGNAPAPGQKQTDAPVTIGSTTEERGNILHRAEWVKENKDPEALKWDNILKITSNASSASLDIRLLFPDAPDFKDSKVNRCIEEVIRNYKEYDKDKGTQIIWCDLSTPKSGRADTLKEAEALKEKFDKLIAPKLAKLDEPGEAFGLDAVNVPGEEVVEGETLGDQAKRVTDKIEALMLAAASAFSVYDDIRKKLIAKGLKPSEIAFVHDYNTKAKKAELNKRMNAGEVRVLIGSTSKMGTGMNVQERLVAMHHLDCPWKPSEIEQRNGRIIRQGNKLYDRDPKNFKVRINVYNTEKTADAAKWQANLNKQKGFESFYNADRHMRQVEDVWTDGTINLEQLMADASGSKLLFLRSQRRKEVEKIRSNMDTWGAKHNRLIGNIESINKEIKRIDASHADAKALHDLITEKPNNDKNKFAGLEVWHGDEGKQSFDFKAFKDRVASGEQPLLEMFLSDPQMGWRVSYRGVTLRPTVKYVSLRATDDGENALGTKQYAFVALGKDGQALVTSPFSDVPSKPDDAGFVAKINHFLESFWNEAWEKRDAWFKEEKDDATASLHTNEKELAKMPATNIYTEQYLSGVRELTDFEHVISQNAFDKVDAHNELVKKYDGSGKPVPEYDWSTPTEEDIQEHNKRVEDVRFRMSKAELDALPAVQISVTDAVKDKHDLKDIFRAFGEVENQNDKRKVIFPTGRAGKIGARERQFAMKFGELFKRAILLFDEPVENWDGHKIRPNTARYHHYVNRAELDGTPYYVRFSIFDQNPNGEPKGTVHETLVSEVAVYNENGERVPLTLGTDLAGNTHSPFVDEKIAQWLREGKPLGEVPDYRPWAERNTRLRAGRAGSLYPTPDLYEARLLELQKQIAGKEEDQRTLTEKARDFGATLEKNLINARAPLFNAIRRVMAGHKVEDDLNVEAISKNTPGRIRARNEMAQRRWIDKINGIFSKNGLDRERFDAYLYALFAEERNAMIAARTYNELDDTFVGDGSGMSNEDARAIIATIHRDPNAEHYREAARLVHEMNHWVANEMAKGGLVSEESVKQWLAKSPHYVPLKDADMHGNGGRGGRGPYMRHATGRHTLASSPYANSVRQLYETIRNIENNRVTQTLAAWLGKYDPEGKQLGARVKGIPGHKQSLVSTNAPFVSFDSPAYAQLKMAGATLVDVPELGGAFVDTGKKLPKGYRVMLRAAGGVGPNVVTYFKGGQRHFIVFDGKRVLRDGKRIAANEAAEIADALNYAQMRRPDGLAWDAIQNVTKLKARLSTGLNPKFLLRNVIADVFNTTNILALEGKYGAIKDVYANLPKAWSVLTGNKYGKGGGNSEVARYFQEASDAGAFTGVFHSANFRDIDGEIKKAIGDIANLNASTIIRRGFRAATAPLRVLVRNIDKVGSILEEGTRLATYVAMRKRGMGVNEAAQYAREITVDFNAKGNYTPVMNALYMFSNAAAQSFARYLKAIRTGVNEHGATKTLIPVVLANLLLGYLAAAFNDDDEEEKDGIITAAGDRIPEFRKREALNFNIPGTSYYITLPTRGAMAPLVHLGSMLHDAQKGKLSATELTGALVSDLFSSTVDFIGTQGSIAQTAAPTVLDPLVQLWENKDWTGAPIHRTDYNQAKSRAYQGKATTPQLYSSIAEAINNATGGDQVQSGSIDLHPETYRHLLDFLTGPISETLGDISTLKTTLRTNEPGALAKIPILGGVLKTKSDISPRYYEAYQDVLDTIKTYNAYNREAQNSKDIGQRRELLEKARTLIRQNRWMASRKALADLSQDIRTLREVLIKERQKQNPNTKRIEMMSDAIERKQRIFIRVYERHKK